MQIVDLNVCQYFNLEKLTMVTSIGHTVHVVAYNVQYTQFQSAGFDRAYIIYRTTSTFYTCMHFLLVWNFWSPLDTFHHRNHNFFFLPKGLSFSFLSSLIRSRSPALSNAMQISLCTVKTTWEFRLRWKKTVSRCANIAPMPLSSKWEKQMFMRQTRMLEMTAKWSTEAKKQNLWKNALGGHAICTMCFVCTLCFATPYAFPL